MSVSPRQQADVFGTLQPYVMRVCQGAECGVRFPVAEAAVAYEQCHLCEAPTVVGARFGNADGERHDGTTTEPARRSVIAILDNVRSAMNVGTIIRTADGTGADTVLMGGISPAASNPKVMKTALGAEETVQTAHHPNLIPVVDDLIASGVRVWALESTPTSVALDELDVPPMEHAIAVIVGNEISGVDPDLLARCERHVHLPMRGVKNSLNVAVAFGTIAWWLQQEA